ncbi:hypothetical protein Q1695_011777 [Nippostrongylus brasiliensis]|nr:hypothetical protein Q1695_011777 [Nippostrongylus brasiliensis]
MVCFAFLQFAIVAERGVALWKRERYEKFGPFLGWSFTVISILISIASTVYVAADVDYEGDSVYCSTATDTTAERVTAQGIGMCVVELIALAGMFALNIFNTMAIKKFTKFFRVQSYQLRENASVIRLMLPLIVFQTLSYILFAAIDATIATVHMQLPYVTYRTLVASFYANYFLPIRISYLSVMQCEEKRQLVGAFWFLLAMYAQLCASLISSVLCILVMKKCLKTVFHVNIKVLFVAMLSLYVVHSLIIAATQTMHLILYKAKDPCTLSISPVTCFCLRFPAFSCMVSFSVMQFFMVVERMAALWKHQRYESYGPLLGILFVAISTPPYYTLISTLFIGYAMRSSNRRHRLLEAIDEQQRKEREIYFQTYDVMWKRHDTKRKNQVGVQCQFHIPPGGDSSRTNFIPC